MGVIAQPSALRLIGALTVVGAYDRLVVKCVIGRLPERVGGRRGWPEVTAGVAAKQVAPVLTAHSLVHGFGCGATPFACLCSPVSIGGVQVLAGLRSQVGVPSPRLTLLGY